MLDDADGAAAPASAAAGRGAEAVAVTRAAQAALANGGFDGVLAHADRRVLALDARGRAELEQVLTRWQATVERIARASATRIARAGQSPAHRCAAIVMCFELPVGLDED